MYFDSRCISETRINSGETLSNFSVCWLALSEGDYMRPNKRQWSGNFFPVKMYKEMDLLSYKMRNSTEKTEKAEHSFLLFEYQS